MSSVCDICLKSYLPVVAELPVKANTKPSGAELAVLGSDDSVGSTNANTNPKIIFIVVTFS